MNLIDLGDLRLRLEKQIGSGAFGLVGLYVDLSKNKRVCVKLINITGADEAQLIKGEIYILSKIQHPHIIQFLRSFGPIKGRIGIIMEYAPGGTLASIINNYKHNPPTDSRILSNICDILMGLEYLHIRQVVHRDLKPANILVDKDGRLKIADFGLSTITQPNTKSEFVGTLLYIAPECYLNSPPSFQSDVWALGLISYEIVCGFHPLLKLHPATNLKTFFNNHTEQCIDCIEIRRPWRQFCSSCLDFNPQRRLTIPQLLRMHGNITLRYYKQYFNYTY